MCQDFHFRKESGQSKLSATRFLNVSFFHGQPGLWIHMHTSDNFWKTAFPNGQRANKVIRCYTTTNGIDRGRSCKGGCSAGGNTISHDVFTTNLSNCESFHVMSSTLFFFFLVVKDAVEEDMLVRGCRNISWDWGILCGVLVLEILSLVSNFLPTSNPCRGWKRKAKTDEDDECVNYVVMKQ